MQYEHHYPIKLKADSSNHNLWATLSEYVLRQESGVKVFESESPPIIGFNTGILADLGTLILTNQRLVYIKKGRIAEVATYLVAGHLVAKAIKNRVSKADLDELSSHEGSISVPLENLKNVIADTKLGNPFICVYCVGRPKQAYSFIVKGGANRENWVATINRAKTPEQDSFDSFFDSENAFDSELETTGKQWICRNCGITYEKAGVCDFCGEPLTQPENSETPWVCPNCGKTSKKAGTCELCGEPYVKQ